MPRKKKDFLFNPVIIVIFVIIFLIAAFNFYQNYQKKEKIETKIKRLEKQIAEAKNENINLQEQFNNSDDYEYIEEVARKRLGLVKKGEKLLIPVEEDQKDEEEKDS